MYKHGALTYARSEVRGLNNSLKWNACTICIQPCNSTSHDADAVFVQHRFLSPLPKKSCQVFFSTQLYQKGTSSHRILSLGGKVYMDRYMYMYNFVFSCCFSVGFNQTSCYKSHKRMDQLVYLTPMYRTVFTINGVNMTTSSSPVMTSQLSLGWTGCLM